MYPLVEDSEGYYAQLLSDCPSLLVPELRGTMDHFPLVGNC